MTFVVLLHENVHFESGECSDGAFMLSTYTDNAKGIDKIKRNEAT